MNEQCHRNSTRRTEWRSLRSILAAACTLVATLTAASPASADSPEGWIYYGASWNDAIDRTGHITDGGKLRPEVRTSPMPRWERISAGDRFRLGDQANLRSEPTQYSAEVLEAPLERDSCVSVLTRAAKPYRDLDLESGGWVKVRVVSCRRPGGVASTSAAGRAAKTTTRVEPTGFWAFLRENREVLAMLGTALATLAGGAWAVFTFLHGRKDRSAAAAIPSPEGAEGDGTQ